MKPAKDNASTLSAGEFAEREFPMTDADFEEIRKVAYKITGISLSDHKKNMVYGRLARRLRQLNIATFAGYCREISSKDSPELPNFVNAITTNLTSFFREFHHFQYLKSTIFPNLIKQNAASKRIRIWSAGCSTGEEAYSIAMVVKTFQQLNSWDLKILATDLDSNVVDTGRRAIYASDRGEKVPAEFSKYIVEDSRNNTVSIKPEVASLVTFKQLNLLHSWPMKGPFDVIFCRNVVIYFDAPTQTKLFDRYADILRPDGHLFIGHSENLHNISDRFQSQGRTIYQRAS